MRRSKEIVVLLALFVALAAFVLWYVSDRRARQAATPPAEPKVVGPANPATAAAPKAEPVDLTKVEGQTVDFSSGKAVVKNSTEDQAAIAAAKKEMDAALAEVSFAPAKKSEPAKP